MQSLKSYLKKLHQSGIERKIPNITPENAEYIRKLLLEKSPENILEIGTANGYSALSFAENFEKTPDDTKSSPKIFTIEYAWNAHNEAVTHFNTCKIKNIFPIWGDAKNIISAFADDFFDVIYIDGMKKEYLTYFLLTLSKARKNALFIFDDAEKFAHKMADLYTFLKDHNIPHELHKTDADDSIMTIRKEDIHIN